MRKSQYRKTDVSTIGPGRESEIRSTTSGEILNRIVLLKRDWISKCTELEFIIFWNPPNPFTIVRSEFRSWIPSSSHAFFVIKCLRATIEKNTQQLHNGSSVIHSYKATRYIAQHMHWFKRCRRFWSGNGYRTQRYVRSFTIARHMTDNW